VTFRCDRLIRRAFAAVAVAALAATLLSGTSTPAGAVAAPAVSKTTWTFTVTAVVPPVMVTKYGGLRALTALVRNQVAAVKSTFNTSLGSSDFKFSLVSVRTYSVAATTELTLPHPGSDLRLVYEENPDDQGGWFGSYQAILHNWTFQNEGDFSTNATEGLTHEFGHFRGAVDEYGEEVAAALNPVNGTAFTAPMGIMNHPYGVHTWSIYSKDILRASAATVYSGAPIVDRSFPTALRVRVLNARLQPVLGAKVALFGVGWFSNSVTSTPVMQGTTTAIGYFQLPRNPFSPGSMGMPWNLAYANFLVRMTYGTTVKYMWMPLTTVGAAYFSAPTKPFLMTFRVP
jgi:hypothetical protein